MLSAKVVEAVAPVCSDRLGTAEPEPVSTQMAAASERSVAPATIQGNGRHTGESTEGAAAGGQLLLSPADMVAALSTEPRETRLERTHAVLDLAASPANRHQLSRRRSAVPAAVAASAVPKPAPAAGCEPALAHIGVLEPVMAATGAGKDRLVPVPHPAQAPEPAALRRVLSAVSARPSTLLLPAAQPGRPSAGSPRPARHQGGTALSLQQPVAICAAAPRSQDSEAMAAPTSDNTASRTSSAPSAPRTAGQRDTSIPPVAASKRVENSCWAGHPGLTGLQPARLLPASASLSAAALPDSAAGDNAKVNALPLLVLAQLRPEQQACLSLSTLRDPSRPKPRVQCGRPDCCISLTVASAHPAGQWSFGQQPLDTGADGTAGTAAATARSAEPGGNSAPAPLQAAQGRHVPSDGAPQLLLDCGHGDLLLTL